MTQVAVSQAGVEVLFRVLPGVRATQAGVEALFRVLPGISVQQAGVEVLHRVLPQFSVSQAGVEVLFKAQPCVSKWAQIWTIERRDGTVMRFTSLDRDLEHGGHLYGACNSFDPSASENAAQVGSVGSMDLSGLIADGAISVADLHAGIYDGARIEASLVPWSGEGAVHALMTGTFGVVSYDENSFTVEVMGDGGRLTQTPLVSPMQPNCRYRWGDSFCRKDTTGLVVSGTVESGQGQRGFTDSARAEAAGYFSRGHVRFTGGANAGIEAQIKLHEAGGVFTLWPRLAFPIAPGDTYEMDPGCTNQKDSADGTNGCSAWGNFVNYGGERGVPGRDKITKTPDVKR